MAIFDILLHFLWVCFFVAAIVLAIKSKIKWVPVLVLVILLGSMGVGAVTAYENYLNWGSAGGHGWSTTGHGQEYLLELAEFTAGLTARLEEQHNISSSLLNSREYNQIMQYHNAFWRSYEFSNQYMFLIGDTAMFAPQFSHGTRSRVSYYINVMLANNIDITELTENSVGFLLAQDFYPVRYNVHVMNVNYEVIFNYLNRISDIFLEYGAPFIMPVQINPIQMIYQPEIIQEPDASYTLPPQPPAQPPAPVDVPIVQEQPPESFYVTIGGERFSTSLTRLSLEGWNMQNADITSLRYMTNLNTLVVASVEVSDLTPLSNLTNLTTLMIRDVPATDLSPLAGLVNLESLDLALNQISDITPLSGLTRLNHLSLWNNQISNLGPLSGLTNLTSLYLSHNQISDIGPLSGLANLTALNLDRNLISSLPHMSGLTSLYNLNLGSNQISDLTPLSGLTNLRYLSLFNNPVSDITPLSNLTSLYSLNLNRTQVSNLAPLSGLTNLEHLHVVIALITDWSPVAHVTYVSGRP